ncbi:MAG: 2-C-methyl-D-erythritol 4-phosphate cytidylyltransferase [Elusimicrobiota bacterium]
MKGNPNINVIILAAGQSKRAKKDKIFFKINGRNLIEIVIDKFAHAEKVTKIILVLSKRNLKRKIKFSGDKNLVIVKGGETRIESLINASKFLDKNCDAVMVHDGARPFISIDMINRFSKLALKHNCVIPFIPLKDTVKKIDIKTGKVIKTIDRNSHFAVQTPQCYKFSVFKKIIIAAQKNKNATDDSQIAEKLSIPVFGALGEENNIKITTPIDLEIAKIIFHIPFKPQKHL